MNEHRGLWGQAITRMAGDNVGRFWSRHGWVLFSLGVVLVATVVCCDLWDGFPRWPVYFLTVVLVTDAVLHARINRAYENSQLQAWHDLLALAEKADANARPGAAKPSLQGPATKPVPKPVPPLRVFWPDDEAARNGS